MKQGPWSWWKQILRWGVCLLALSVLVGRSGHARADVAPWQPPFGTNPEPDSAATKVRMMAETVLMEVEAQSPYNAHVTASFTMRNLGETVEQMEVGFPLDQTTSWGNICGGFIPFNPIVDLQAWVDGSQVNTEKDYRTMEFPFTTGTVTETVPCWEHFPVTFPVEKDVQIQITYTGEPYNHDKAGSYIYQYILFTGAAWYETIGSADITVRMPYEINAYNYNGCNADCTVTSHEVQWHFEDLEPEGGVGASFVPPPVWKAIQVEKANTANNPKDGEAWGRLGKAYKWAISTSTRYAMDDQVGLEMYQWSVEAYQKALELLPSDADWHYGYADLLCTKAIWNDGGIVHPENVDWQPCLEQLQQALTLNPEHERALELAQDLKGMKVITIDGNQLIKLTFPPTPTYRPTLMPTVTQTRIPTRTQTPFHTLVPPESSKPTITRLPSITETIPAVSATAILIADRTSPNTLFPPAMTLTAAPAGAAVPDRTDTPKTSAGVIVGVGIILLALVIALVVTRLRRG